VKTIRKVLVANRGEIARRVFRTCREMGIATVAVFSEPDRDAPFVQEADEAVPLGGASPAESYLRGDAIVAAALLSGADAIHPGYGFLSENADFARRVAASGLFFIGPPPEAIAAMGGKLAAKALMQKAGVPVLPGAEVGGAAAALAKAAAAIGFPVLVKASAGGGGRGMRIVREAAGLEDAVARARSEAKAAFGDDAVFLERYLDAPRHVEIQVFGDAHGNVVSLFERECSIQRRYQKVIEESPSPAVDERLREVMGAAAVVAARAVSYVGAGTVEFLLTEGREFFFLEMNTRLQVEHPVTEAVTGLDLVRLQIHVAEGDVLPREAMAPSLSGHAIEARLYAEDPENGFLPVSGVLHRFRVPASPGIRVDAGVADGSVVGVHYDSLLAKVVAHAPSRAEAAARLAAALERSHIHGLVTNRDLLVGVLRRLEFLEGRTDTHFFDRHPPATLIAPAFSADAERQHAVAAALAAAHARREAAPVLGFLPSGWRNNPSQLQEVAFEGRSGRIEVGYAWRREGLVVRSGGGEQTGLRARVHGGAVDLEMGGVRRRYEVNHAGDMHFVDSSLGHTALAEVPRFNEAALAEAAGSLRAPMPGRVIRVGAVTGAPVAAGAVLVVLEAMKMEHQVTAPRSGTLLEVRVKEGQQVDAGQVLAVLDGES
jgi:acetyl-CoA carboxylase biotin carboxylase subunit